MLVAVAQFDMLIPGSSSLKDKRFVLNSLKARIRNKFNVSVAEVDENEKWQRTILGIALVSNERRFIDQVMGEILRLIEQDGQVEVVQHQIEVF
jgi:uncharacterized protein